MDRQYPHETTWRISVWLWHPSSRYHSIASSCSAYPVSVAPWVCGSYTRDLTTYVPGSGETNPGFRSASVVTVPSMSDRLDGAHTASGDSYGQRPEGTPTWRKTTSTESFFSHERRRLCGHLILVYNIFHGRLGIPQVKFFEAPAERKLRVPNFKIRHRRLRLLRRKTAYSVRLPGPMDRFPEHFAYARSVGTFKRLLDVAEASLFLLIDFLHGFMGLTMPLVVNQYNRLDLNQHQFPKTWCD